MKFFKTILFISVVLLVIWIDLPAKIGKQPVGSRLGQKYFTTHLGLDLKGGSHFVFQADTTGVKPQDLEDTLNSSRDIIERRVNFFGVSEPSIQTLKVGNAYRITVDLPGVENTAEAVSLLGKTAQLTFREEMPLDPKYATLAALMKSYNPKASLTGKDIQKASVVYDPQTGKPQVQLTFTVSINSGALPLPIKLIEQRSIGPTLGASEIQKSVYAGAVGLMCVMFFMILYYGRLGFIACAGLIVYGALSYALFKAIPVTLTLSGIAGFILSIGMAVDSNILIFERIKEEMRKGRDRRSAIRLGFGRAIDAIKDANITTLLVAFILFNPLNWEFLPQFGLVRGFALTLAIGVIMSLFTGVIVTRKLIEVFYKAK
ncbi:preprotein translocase subunit SecD [Candidatus Microgenomates bacterium]|nr:preprotein translocase subunit SecD [Candidatus Microgenomates bacterium]